MRLIIVRHGLTVESASDIRMGQSHGKLSQKGILQAQKLGKRLKKENIDFIYSSDLGRTKETLFEILKFVDAPVAFDPLLRERSAGIFEGKSAKEYHEAANKSGLGRKFRPEKGESFYDLKDRVVEFMEKLKENHSEKDTILLCTHGGWKNCFLCYLLGLSVDESFAKYQFKNTSVSIFELDGNGNHSTKTLNSVEHLQ